MAIFFLLPLISSAKVFLSDAPPIHSVLTYKATPAPDTADGLTFVLRGSAIPAGIKTKGYFRYSAVDPLQISPLFCNDVYGSNMIGTNETYLSNDKKYSANDSDYGTTAQVQFSQTISGLAKNTKYYYCAFASDKNVIESGAVQVFTTSPLIETDDATVPDSASAILNGFYSATTDPIHTYFQYRKTSPSGTDPTKLPNWTETIPRQSHKMDSASNFDETISGLSENTDYDFRAVSKNDTSNAYLYGNTLTFKTLASDDSNGDTTTGCASGDDLCNSDQIDTNNNTTTPHSLGDVVTPPDLALVHSMEGIETVLARQIQANTDIAEAYGYKQGGNLVTFSWYLADILARDFGYVSSNGEEIRVSKPDVAAYELQMKDGNLTIYEYYNSKIVNIQTTSNTLRSKYYYEYYYSKK